MKFLDMIPQYLMKMMQKIKDHVVALEIVINQLLLDVPKSLAMHKVVAYYFAKNIVPTSNKI